MTNRLRKLLRDLDQPHDRLYPYDEITMLQPWPIGTVELFTSLGILEEMTDSGEVWLDDCVDPDWADPTWLFSQAKGRVLGYCSCGWGCGGMHIVERERGRQWRPGFEGLTRCVAAALGLDEGWVEDVPGRMRLLGTLEHKGRRREVFLSRGLTWPDSPAVLAQARRLAGATNAVMLCPAALPPVEQRQRSWRAVISLEQASTIKNRRLVLHRATLFKDEAARPIPEAEYEMLTEQDLDVLEALAAKPKVAMGIAEIMAAAGYSKGTIRNILARLSAGGLVGHPPGTRRKGVAITTAGIAALRMSETSKKQAG